jgi:hypothetical protein
MSDVANGLSALKPIYDPRRALEHVQTVQGIVPVRLFALLFPLWDIETTANQEEKRPYELMERYVERGIGEGQLHTIEELATFFGLQSEIVSKILHFLESLSHVTQRGSRWELTELGSRSVREGKKYVAQEKRIRFYFDAYTSKPLRKEHYEGKKVRIFEPEEAAHIIHSKTWGYRFHLVTSMREWQANSLLELEARHDRANYNMPAEMREVRVLAVRPAYIPMYIIETTRKMVDSAQRSSEYRPYYLVYTGIRDLRDTYFEQLINNNKMIYTALRGEKVVSQHDLWLEWLRSKGLIGILPLERADGTWQISLPTSVFEGAGTKFPTTRVGDYELRDGYFLQIWCDDKVLRRRAALDRLLRMVKNQQSYIKRQTIHEQLSLLASQLQIADLSFDELRQRAQQKHMNDIIRVLDDLQR